ncbi:TM2 domain-containing protein [Clostridium sp.]|uniref:TM2 domain-containing protein n=1 Tax=Clostridium sp. TaxID=1506 RepID=UPI003BB7B316
MAKIIKIEDDLIFIGLDDGSIKKVNKSYCNFSHDINDEVEIYESESCIVVNKIDSSKKKSSATNSKIDINVNNNSPTGNPVYVANNKKTVNKVIYCLLALLLGGIGAHKFYAGKIAAGILYLLFFWTCIPVIIAFIEFILALCKTEDSNGNILV